MAKTKRAARHSWTAEEEATLRRDYADTPTSELAARLGLTIEQVWSKAQRLGIKKSARYRRSSHSGCARPGERRGQATEFKKGAAPHNKGRKFSAGGRSAETRFRPGCAPHNTVAVGTVVTDCDGYLKKRSPITGTGMIGSFCIVWFGSPRMARCPQAM